MARGGFCKLPNGTVVVALTLPAPVPDGTAPVCGAAPVTTPGDASDAPRCRGDGRSSGGDGGTVRVVVHAVNRSRALTRLRNLGLRSVYLRGNAHPPTPDEVTAVLHHPDGLIWRTAPLREDEMWHPIGALFRAPGAWARPVGAGRLSSASSASSAEALGFGSGLPAEVPAYLVAKPLTVPEAWTASEA